MSENYYGTDGKVYGRTALSPSQSTPTDRSGTLTANNTSQQVMPLNVNRRYLLFQNVSDIDLWINFGTQAVAGQPSIKVLPSAAFVMESSIIFTSSLNVIGATSGKAFVAKEA